MILKHQVRDEVLHVTLLGEFRIAFGETAVSGIINPIYQSLFAYLILNRNKVHTRRQLAYQFWPDSTDVQARTNLRKAIYHLRQQLPHVEKILRLERHRVQWRSDAPVLVDVLAFSTTVSSADAATTPTDRKEHLIEAINCYQGDFLIGHYDDWVLTTREQLRQQYFCCLETLIQILEEEQAYNSAIAYAQQLLSADPLHEVAYRRLMRLQAENGRFAAALRTYHTCTTTLQNELGVSPSPATQALYQQLLQTNVPIVSSIPARTSLVAREDAWNTLQAAWSQVQQGRPQLTLISGEAGIGKTRLAEELLHWAARQGFSTVASSCYAAQGQLPYAPITAWLRSKAMQKPLNRLGDKWLREISRLLPELLAERPDLAPPGPLTEGWQRQHFFTALAQAVLHVRQPLLLFIDDLQWCDSDTLDWLHFLLCFNQQAHLMLLGTIRSEEVDDIHPLHRWQQHVRQDDNLFEIHLKRLDEAATCTLAEQIVHHELNVPQASWLYAETEGIPLFVVEMARADLQQREAERLGKISSLPDKVRSVLEMRLGQLSPPARELCGLAATIGRSFTFDLLAAACEQNKETLVTCLDELWQRRIVREQGMYAYDFSHDKLRQAAYAGLGLARRHLLHSQIIKALEMLYADNLDKVCGQLAAHYEAVQQWQKAIEYYQRAAQVSNHIFAHQETMQHLRRAITLLSKTTVSPKRQADLHELLGDVLALSGAHEAAQELFETAVFHIQDPVRQSQLYRKIANTWSVRQEANEALQAFQTAEQVLGKPGETARDAWRQEWLWIQIDRLWVLYLINRNEEMSQLSEQMRPVLDKYGLPVQRGFYFQRLMLLGYRRERYVLSPETIRHTQASLTAIEESGHIGQIAFARFALGMSHLWCGWHGNLDEAECHMQMAQSEAEEISDVVLQSRILTYLTLIYRRRRDIDKVRDYLPRAMAASQKANMQQYIAQTQGNMAWLAWVEGDLKKTQKMGQASLENCKSIPTIMPFWGMGLWPLIAANVQLGDIAAAVTHAQLLLDPRQLRMPEGVTAVLQQAIIAWENNQPDTVHSHLNQALQQAQTYHYL